MDPPLVGVAVKVILDPAQIEVVLAPIVTEGVTEDAIFPLPVGLLVVGVFAPPPFPPISIPKVGTDASMVFPLQVMLDLMSTTSQR